MNLEMTTIIDLIMIVTIAVKKIGQVLIVEETIGIGIINAEVVAIIGKNMMIAEMTIEKNAGILTEAGIMMTAGMIAAMIGEMIATMTAATTAGMTAEMTAEMTAGMTIGMIMTAEMIVMLTGGIFAGMIAGMTAATTAAMTAETIAAMIAIGGVTAEMIAAIVETGQGHREKRLDPPKDLALIMRMHFGIQNGKEWKCRKKLMHWKKEESIFSMRKKIRK